jgi:hypothetical protein
MMLYYMAKIHPQLQWDKGQWVALTEEGGIIGIGEQKVPRRHYSPNVK